MKQLDCHACDSFAHNFYKFLNHINSSAQIDIHRSHQSEMEMNVGINPFKLAFKKEILILRNRMPMEFQREQFWVQEGEDLKAGCWSDLPNCWCSVIKLPMTTGNATFEIDSRLIPSIPCKNFSTVILSTPSHPFIIERGYINNVAISIDEFARLRLNP